MNDTISRQAAIDIYDDYNIAVENGELEAYGRYRKQLCDLPSAQTEQRTDEWKPIKDCPMRHENGNCLPAGGFCTANKNICEALHNAYEMGKSKARKGE